jgi:hypothetical protein
MSFSFSDAMMYQRDMHAARSRILAALMPTSLETSGAMQVIIVAAQTGTNVNRLAKETGIAAEQIRCYSKRLREAKIWHGNSVNDIDWLDVFTDRKRMGVILSQALVARGLLNREWIDEGAVYRDQRGKVVARFGRFEPFVDCLDALLHLESRSQQALVSSKS